MKPDLSARKDFRKWTSMQEKHSRLVSNQVLLAGQNILEDADDSDKLVVISLPGALDLFGMEVAEPSSLTKVRPLTGHLEVQILLGVVLLGEGGVADLVVLVIRVHQVFKDSTRLPQGKAGIRVLNSRRTAIGVDFSIGLTLHIWHEPL